MSYLLVIDGTQRGVPAGFHDTAFSSAAYYLIQGYFGTGIVSFVWPNPTLLPRPSNSGQLSHSYKDLYFGFLRYSAEEFAFGIIAEEKFSEVEVWNSVLDYSPQNSVISLGLPSDGSLIISATEAAPYLMSALGSYVYRITASLEGDPVIKDSLDINYDIQPDVSFPVTGLRVIVFDYKHNWDKAIEQSYVWNTDVLNAKDGTEQRVKLRATPRMQLTYSMLVENEKAEQLNNLLVAWGDKPFVVPLWMDCCSTNGVSSLGQPVLNINETTGTDVNSSTLFYMPFTGEIHAASSVVSTPNPAGDALTDTFIAVDDLNELREYDLQGVGVVYISITATIAANTTVTIYNDEGVQVVQLTNQTVDNTTEYPVKGGKFSVHVLTIALANTTDIIVDARDNSEVCSITLSNNLTVEIPDGTVIYPCVLAHITMIKEYKAHHDKLKGLDVMFSSEVLPEFPELVTTGQYLSDLVETKSPHWNDGQKQGITSNLFIQDYKSGIIGFGRTKEFIGANVARNELLLTGREIKQFKEELQRRSGRLRPHWLPTFTADVTVVVAGLFTDDFIIVEDNNNDLIFSRSEDYRHIRVLLRSGAVFYRKIISVVADGTNMKLTLDSVLGVDFDPEDFLQVSYMSYVRGDSDSTTLVWEHRKLVKVQQTFRGVVQ